MSGKMDLSEEKPAVTDRLRDPDSLAGQFCGGATGINRENREKKKKKKVHSSSKLPNQFLRSSQLDFAWLAQ